MDIGEIKKLITFMDENKLIELEYEENGKRVRLKKADDRPQAATGIRYIPGIPDSPSVASPQGPPPTPERPANQVEFSSPLVGTFYTAPKPDADPFVEVGDTVTVGQVLCIVEAMKVMNEIKAEEEGTIREILVKNGEAVEFGRPLFLIEKSDG